MLPARVLDYQSSMLDELMTTGEVIWAGHGGLGADGWVSLHLADTASLTLPSTARSTRGTITGRPRGAAGGGAFFFGSSRPPSPRVDDKALSAAVWDLTWAGRVGNDTLAPLRALNRGGRSAHRVKRGPARVRGRGPGSPAPPSAPRHPRSPVAGSCCRIARPTPPSARTRLPRACS